MLGEELSWVWTINQNLSVERLQLTNPLKKSYKSEWMSLENTFYPIFSKLVRPFYPPGLIDIPLNRTFTTYSVHLLSGDLSSSKAIYWGVSRIIFFKFHFLNLIFVSRYLMPSRREEPQFFSFAWSDGHMVILAIYIVICNHKYVHIYSLVAIAQERWP